MTKEYPSKPKAKGKPVTKSTKMNEAEEKWEREAAELMHPTFLPTEIVQTRYTPITFRFGTLRYTPDFMHLCINGDVAFVEVKASKFSGNVAYSMARLKSIAAAFWWFDFYFAVQSGSGWSIEKIKIE